MKSVPSVPPVTQADIARALGIADSTVSRALKNNPKIPAEHRRHIQETAQRMGYRINPMASALAQWKQNLGTNRIQSSLAWLNLWPDPKKLHHSREFDGYWRGARKAAEKLGYHVEEFIVNEGLPLPRLESILEARGINGILLPPHPFPPAWGGFDWRNFSIVRYGRSCPTPKTHLVTSDQMQNVILALQTIRARGYWRVGFVTGKWSTRRGGWMQAGAMLHQSTVPKKEQVPMLLFGDQAPGITHQKLHERCLAELAAWMKKHRPDAIFTDVGNLRQMLADTAIASPTMSPWPATAFSTAMPRPASINMPRKSGASACSCSFPSSTTTTRASPPFPARSSSPGVGWTAARCPCASPKRQKRPSRKATLRSRSGEAGTQRGASIQSSRITATPTSRPSGWS